MLVDAAAFQWDLYEQLTWGVVGLQILLMITQIVCLRKDKRRYYFISTFLNYFCMIWVLSMIIVRTYFVNSLK